MKRKNEIQSEKPIYKGPWITKKEAKAICRRTSDNGWDTFVNDHKLQVNKQGNRCLYIPDEVHAAMNSGLVTMGL